jgi:RNA polymerase sigma-70 factor (ECF subfamily)
MALSEFDRNLLQRCLAREPRSWENFVDRFLGLVLHVVNHTAQSRSMRLTDQDREDLVADIFLAVVRDDFAVLKQFRGKSSLATYLTVVARRVVVRELMKRNSQATLSPAVTDVVEQASFEQRISNEEEVARLLSGLPDSEAEVVRMYHLEGKSYSEISSHIGMPENSVGPMLSRARSKMRNRASQTS